MRRTGCLTMAAAAAIVAWLSPTVQGQSGTKNGEWPTYGGDLGHTRYAPLDQITAANFTTLEVAWRFKTDNLGPRPEFNLESTPLMVGGRLYSTGGTRRSVVALDAATGELLWVHGENEGARGAGGAAPALGPRPGLLDRRQGRADPLRHARLSPRGARREDRTAGARLRPQRHRRSEAGLRSGHRPDTAPVGLHSTPIVAGDVVIVGAAFETGANPKSRATSRATSAASTSAPESGCGCSARFPRPGEFGNETWLNDSWAYTGNTGVWAQISVDEELGLAYLPVELPTHDYYGGARPGEQSLRREPRRRRPEDRPAEVALPAGAPRHLGHGHPVRADPCGHHRQRPDGQGASRSRRSRRSCTSSIA